MSQIITLTVSNTSHWKLPNGLTLSMLEYPIKWWIMNNILYYIDSEGKEQTIEPTWEYIETETPEITEVE